MSAKKPAHASRLSSRRIMWAFAALTLCLSVCKGIVVHKNGQSPEIYYHRASQWTGRGYNATKLEMFIPEHPDLCNADELAMLDLKGKAVLGFRGNCSFAEKAANLVKPGASAMIIGNYHDQLITMAGTAEVDFPCVLVEATTFMELEAKAGQSWFVDVNRFGAVSDNFTLQWAMYGLFFLALPGLWCLFLIFLCVRRRIRYCLLRAQTTEAAIQLPQMVFRKPSMIATSAHHYGLVPTDSSITASASMVIASSGVTLPSVEFMPKSEMGALPSSYYSPSALSTVPDGHSGESNSEDSIAALTNRMFPNIIGFVEGKLTFSRESPPTNASLARAPIPVHIAQMEQRQMNKEDSLNFNTPAKSSAKQADITLEVKPSAMLHQTSTSLTTENGNVVLRMSHSPRSGGEGGETETVLAVGHFDSSTSPTLESPSTVANEETIAKTPLLMSHARTSCDHVDSSLEMQSANSVEGKLEDIPLDHDQMVSNEESLKYVLPKVCLSEITRVHSDSCTICLDDYDDGTLVRVLPCKHAFHPDCIQPWLEQRSDQCPMCKQSIRQAFLPSTSELPKWERALRFVCCIQNNITESPRNRYVCCCIPNF